MNLQNWIDLARQHWTEHLPQKVQQLRRAGKLEKALREAANQTYSLVDSLEAQGMGPEEAWQQARTEFLLLPPEESPEEAPTDAMNLLREIALVRQHAERALADPSYRIPEPPSA
mgnify:CR=1 FL=1